jgi:heat shock protein HtpX
MGRWVARGAGVFNLNTSGEAWRGGRIGNTIPGAGPCVAFALVPAGSHAGVMQVSRSGATVVVEMHLPTDRPGLVLRCQINASSQDLLCLRRQVHQTANYRSSTWAISGMVLLLAVCGWIVGGAEGAHRAVTEVMPLPRSNGPAISRENMYRWFGAQLLGPAEMPGLFQILTDVCIRARLSRLPDLYYLAVPSSMNAYALGGPDNSAIVLTEGLLRGMTPGEVAGILAHEVAHIRNNDAWAMSWAAALHRAIEWTSLAGLALLRANNGGTGSDRPLATLLSAAPTIGRLLGLALSRLRELDADATALELTGDSQGLIAALGKLERHHTGSPIMPVSAFEDDGPTRLLRSHPATAERVGTLLSLAH